MENTDDVVGLNGASRSATETTVSSRPLPDAADRATTSVSSQPLPDVADRTTAEFWNQKYDAGYFPWHFSTIHPELEGHIDSLINGRQNVRVLFPLCGMDIGLKWLSELGHNVTGIEWSETAINSFFKDQKLKYTREAIPTIEGQVFKTDDSKIQIYMCDLYQFNRQHFGSFDAIWDCGSFEAIQIEQRTKYIAHIISLMSKSCRYLLVTCEYYQKATRGPYPVMKEDIQTLFGTVCNIELLSTSPIEQKTLNSQGVDPVIQNTHLLTLKPDNC